MRTISSPSAQHFTLCSLGSKWLPETVFADLYEDEPGHLIVSFELLDHVEYEGPEIPLELEEDIPF